MSTSTIEIDIESATCLIRNLQSKNIGTGWLFSMSGYILTAGHLFYKKSNGKYVLDEKLFIELQFPSCGEWLKADLIHHMYDENSWVDFSIIKIDPTRCKDINPIPVCFEDTEDIINFLKKDITIFGYSAFDKGSVACKPEIFNLVKSKYPRYKYSSQSLAPGYSGSAIFNNEINASIGVHMAMSDIRGNHPGNPYSERDARYGMPLFRINQQWPAIEEITKAGGLRRFYDQKNKCWSPGYDYSHATFRKLKHMNIVSHQRQLVISIKCNNYDKRNDISKMYYLYERIYKALSIEFGSLFRTSINGETIIVACNINACNYNSDLTYKIIEYILKLFESSQSQCNDSDNTEAYNLMIGMSSGNGYYDGNYYQGNAIEIAKSLMECAWPKGIVIQKDAIPDINIEGLNSKFKLPNTTNPTFTKKEFFVLSANRENKTSCYATNTVVNWNCLAWPGFEHITTQYDSGNTLNSIGITFLTHEGLDGNLKTIQLWPSKSGLKNGEKFDLIIDDYDSIAMKVIQNEIDIAEGPFGKWEPMLVKKLRKMPWKTGGTIKPLFIPIRCGLNSIAYASGEFRSCSRLTTYYQIYKECRTKNYEMAIFDNFGSFMPILLSIYFGCTDSTYKAKEDIYEVEIDVAKVLEWLKEEQGDKEHLFQIYSEIHNLSHAVYHRNAPTVVLGGGAWLCKKDSSVVEVFIPKEEYGYLWVEGVVFDKKAKYENELENFIVENMLSLSFQNDITNVFEPYISFPVNSTTLLKITKEYNKNRRTDTNGKKKNGRNEESQYHKERTAIFKTSNRLNDNIIIRQSPKHIKEWKALWQQIRNFHSVKG